LAGALRESRGKKEVLGSAEQSSGNIELARLAVKTQKKMFHQGEGRRTVTYFRKV